MKLPLLRLILIVLNLKRHIKLKWIMKLVGVLQNKRERLSINRETPREMYLAITLVNGEYGEYGEYGQEILLMGALRFSLRF